MQNHFYVIDVETANADCSSICQIGIAGFRNGSLYDTWESLINPKQYFDPFNVGIHGISEEMVSNAPTFPDIHGQLSEKLKNMRLLHHMPFDRGAIARACGNNGINNWDVTWMDSAKIVRRTWLEFAYSGYALKKITKHLGIEYSAHNALEDAIATGKVVISALEASNLLIEDWEKRIAQPILPSKSGKSQCFKMEGNPEGILYGEAIVFTGSLFLPRVQIATIAAEAGCKVQNSVTKETTLLVVGIQDAIRLAGYSKSSKHRKAEKLISTGQDLKILSEQDFIDLLNQQ